MKIKNNLIYSIIITLFLTTWIIYNRFIRIRLPKDIIPQHEINYLVVTIACTFIISFWLLIYFLLTYLKIIPRPNSRVNKLIKKVLTYLEGKQYYQQLSFIFTEYCLKAPEKVYENIIYPNIYLRPFIRYTGAKLSYYFQENPRMLYVIFFILPKIIPWIILFIELCFYHNIKFFYKSLLLFLIPLILSIIIYMIKHHCIIGIDLHKVSYDFEYIDETIHIYLRNLPNPSPEELKKQEENAGWAGDDWYFLQNLYSISYKFLEKKETYGEILRILRYSLISLDFLIYLLLLLGII